MDRDQVRSTGKIKTGEILKGIDVEGYGLDMDEQVAAGAVKAYLSGLPQQEALTVLRSVAKGTVLKIPALHTTTNQKPELLRTIIKGPELIGLIDTAVSEQMEILRDQTAAGVAGACIRETALQALKRIHGQLIVENATPEFLCFLMDCYRELRE